MSASDCAANLPESSNSGHTRVPNVPNFVESPPVNGSSFPEKLAYSSSFLTNEKFTEQLAVMPVTQKSALGFALVDLIVDCQYEDHSCDIKR